MRRRTFMTAALAAGALPLLAGCDRLSRNERFVRLLESAETVNRRLHYALTPPGALAREFTQADLSPLFPSNGTSNPADAAYQRHRATGFRDWRLVVGGLVERPAQLSLSELRALPDRTQITRTDCVEGWSAIAKWRGVRLGALLATVRPLPAARYVMFHCADPMDWSGARYYESIDLQDAHHEQTLLAYEWNDQPLPVPYGAPLRLRVERQLGYKMAKYLMALELVADFAAIRGGRGGYWEDQGYEWYAGI